MPSNIFLSSIKKSYNSVIHHKLLFILLFVLQLIFFSLLLTTQTVILPQIQSLGSEMMDYMDSISGSADASGQGIDLQKGFGDDPFIFFRNTQRIIQLIAIDFLICLGVFLIIGNLLWSFSSIVIHGSIKFKEFMKRFGKFIVVSLSFIVPFSLIAILILQFSLLRADNESIEFLIFGSLLLILFVVAGYFLMVALSLLHLPLKQLFRKTFRAGALKPHLCLAFMAFVLVVNSLILALMLFSAEIYFLLFVLLIIIFIIAHIYLRILLVASISEIEKRV